MRQQRIQLMTILRGSFKACLGGLTTSPRRLSYKHLGGRVGLAGDAWPLLRRRYPPSSIGISSLPYGSRTYSTGSGFIPRGLIFRAFWTGVTATIGYLYYQISQASSWLQEQFDMLRLFGAESLGSALDLLDALGRWRPTIKRKEEEDRQPSILGVVEGVEESVSAMTEARSDDRFRDFIRKMIEVRNILKQAEMDDPTGSHESLMLPSIVVIGSQSSGKSSVLESIVGHEFLPKGTNMVTRRPLELTLVNSTTTGRDYAVFPGPGEDPSPIYDFAQVRRRLEQLNAAVPADDWISPHPIELTIHSRHVPDLSLVDLPGYIQVTSKSQPSVLRDRIARLCERYIQQNNIILAVCAADVDLANAEALKAARTVDPTGQRTIGVLTKLDLVDAQYATQIILNDDYPLRLGYVGVICRPPEGKSGSLGGGGGGFSFLSSSSSTTTMVSTDPGRYEDRYIREHERTFEPVKHQLGVGCLRQKLTQALETSMAHSLLGVLARVNNELAEVRYALKVEYNDRSISPEAYVAFLAGSVKSGLERVARDYNKAKVRSIVRSLLEERLLAVIEETLWMTMLTENPGSGTSHVADARLEMAVDQLTRSGIGRMVANGLVDAIIAQTKMIIREGPLAAHPAASERLISQVEGAMRERCHLAIEQIENAIKPLKHDGMDVDWTGEELGLGESSAATDRADRWRVARTRLVNYLQSVEHRWDRQLRTLQAEVGPRRLRAIVKRLSQPVSAGGTATEQEAPAVSSLNPTSRELVGKVQQIVQLNRQLKILRGRLAHLESSECANLASFRDGASPSIISSLLSGWWWPILGGRSEGGSSSNNNTSTSSNNSNTNLNNSLISGNSIGSSSSSSSFSVLRRCPEIYLYVVMERLLGTASLHAHHELVYEFLHPFPEHMTLANSSNSHGGGGTQELLPMIQENPVIYRHWQLQERRKILERARDRLQFLQQYRSQSSSSPGAVSAVSEFSDAEK